MRGRDIRALRKQKKITQAELRRAIGRSGEWLVAVENEQVLPLPEDEEAIILKIHELSSARQEAAA